MRTYILILAIVLLSGCANMDVQVDIFDPKGLTPDDTLRASVERQAATHAYLRSANKYSEAKVQLLSELHNYLIFLAAPENAVVSKDNIEVFTSSAKKVIDRSMVEAVLARTEGTELTNQAAETLDKNKKRALYGQAQLKFESAMQSLIDLREKVNKPFKGLLKKTLSNLEKATVPDLQKINRLITTESQFKTSLANNITSLTGGMDLLDDPIAAVIISSDDKHWKGIYNKATAQGQFGNTDVAIKMETLGTFTIKGMRLDAGKVTEASFQVLRQGVKMVAAAYGIPSASATQGDTPDDGTTPSDYLQNVEQLRQSAEHKRRLFRGACLTLLDIIVAERNLLVQNADKRAAAVIRLKKSFAAYKSQLAGQ